MKRLLPIVLLLAAPVFAADPESEEGSIAHGSEEAVHQQVRGEGDDAHDAGGHGGEETKYFLGIPVWIWKFFNMVAFLGLLSYLLAGPIKRYFAGRRDQIRTSLAEAETRRERADRMSEEIEAKLAALESEIVAIRERADDEGKRIAEQIRQSTERDLEKVKTAARNEVEQRSATAKRELREHAAKLAAERAEEILERSITESDRDRLFDQGLRKLEEAGS